MKAPRGSGKWVEGVTAEMPVSAAAALLLRARLMPLPELLLGAAQHADEDVEFVHQLRVVSRRAGAALQVFAAACPDTAMKTVARQCRDLRRAAGAARSDDVHDDVLKSLGRGDGDAKLRRGVKLARRMIHDHRMRSQAQIIKCAARFPADALTHAYECLLTGIAVLGDSPATNGRAASDSLQMRQLARQVLPSLIESAHEAGEADLTDLTRMHALRIAGKKLRYAMEIFAPCFPPSFKDELYPHLEDLQSRLGDVNDAFELAARAKRLERVLCKSDDATLSRTVNKRALRALRVHFEQLRDRRQRMFLTYWAGPAAADFLERLATQVAVADAPARQAAWGSASGGGFYATHRFSELAAFQRESNGARVAAIDIGTNSIRLIVAEADERTRYRIIEDVKDTTRLGAGLYFTGRLGFQAIRNSLRALENMKAIAQRHHVARIRAAATAAVRDASNGQAFSELVKRRVNLSLETIDAEQEARLAHSSVAHAFDIDDQRVAVVDIGGGSTEVVLSTHGFVDSIAKLPLGAVHLTEVYCGPDPLGMYRFDDMVAAIDKTLERNLSDSHREPEAIIGTGGTFTTLAKVSLRRGLFGSRDGRLPFDLRGYTLNHAEVRMLLDWLRLLPLEERRRIPGVSRRRAEIVVAGVAIVERLMQRLGCDVVRVHDGGIRDGLVTQMLDEMGFRPQMRRTRSVEMLRQVRSFARQCRYEQGHSEHVARLALAIFDQLAAQDSVAAQSWLLRENRDLLYAAALLHDVGVVVDYDRHHKHSYDLIVKSRMTLFTRRELELIANIARYHRRAEPSANHTAFAHLSDDDRRLVAHLAGVLRIADGLDRLHTQNVRAVIVRVGSRRARFTVAAEELPDVNLRYARRKCELFEKTLGLSADFQWRDAPALETLE